MKGSKFAPFVVLFLALMLVVSSMVAFAEDVQITILNSKGEIQDELEQIASYYSSITEGVTVEVIAAPVGQSPFERTVALYASGNAPALSMLDPGDVLLFQDRTLALNNEKWVADAIDNALDMVTTDDGRIIAFPVTVEAFGFVYNKVVLDRVLGEDFNATKINSRASLEKLLVDLDSSNDGAIVISPEDWSLGAHFFSLAYSGQSPNFGEINAYMDRLRAGNVDLKNDPVVNGLLDTFDLMKEYNVDKLDPLASTYDRATELIGEGGVGLWFMGNWAWPEIRDFAAADGEYGFLPVPISNEASGFGNTQIPVGVTKYFILDGEQNSPAQQQAAKDFLNWLVYDSVGQEHLVLNANIIPAFKNISIAPQDPLSAAVLDYVRNELTMNFVLNLPPDHWAQVGASMQKYLSNFIDRDGFFTEVEEYWEAL